MTDPVRAPAAPAQKGHNELGALPEWDLTDLYPAVDSPELQRDLAWAKSEAKAFEAAYKGKLDGLAKAGRLYEAVERSEKLGDVTYTVVVALEEEDPRLKWRMTAVVTLP